MKMIKPSESKSISIFTGKIRAIFPYQLRTNSSGDREAIKDLKVGMASLKATEQIEQLRRTWSVALRELVVPCSLVI